MEIIRHKTASDFLERAGAWLEQAEAENNFILGVTPLLKNSSEVFKISPYYITLEEAGTIGGVAFMNPPRRLFITHMPAQAVVILTDYLLDTGAPVPGVNGPKTEADLFAEYWATKTDNRLRLKMSQRIYACENVITVARSPGRLRSATKDDESLLVDWAGEFCRDAGIADEIAHMKAQIPNLTAKGWLYVWENSEVVSMADLGRETAHGFSLSLVYTPRHLRNKGYATSCVAELTKSMLDSGKKFCCLYADLANPASNSIYQKIGYQPVCDVQDWVFE